MVETVTAAAPRDPMPKRPGYAGLNPMQAAMIYGGAASTVMGPLGLLVGLGAGIVAKRQKDSFLEREAAFLDDLSGSQSSLKETIRGELDIADPDERRALANAQRVADDGYRKLAMGDPTGKQLVDAANSTIENIINGDIGARKTEAAANAGFMRDLVKTAATDYRTQFATNLREFEQIDQQANRVLSLTAEPGFDPNKPVNRAILAELVSSGMGMYRDTPDTLDAVGNGVTALGGAFGTPGMIVADTANAVIDGIKAGDHKLSAEDFNRLALNMQRTARQYAEQRMTRLGEQATSLDTQAKRIGAIPSDYSLSEYVSGAIDDLPSPLQRNERRATMPAASPMQQPALPSLGEKFRELINRWNQTPYHQQQARPTND